MKVYSPIFHSLLYLYLSIDKDDVAEELEARILEKGESLVIDHPKYSLYVVKNRAHWKLESQDTFYDLAPFSITLGHQKRLLTKRVINELKVKLFKVIKEHDRQRAHQYINYLFRQKLSSLINEMAGEGDKVLWKNQKHLNLYNLDRAFCDRYKFNATITIEKKFIAMFSVAITYHYAPCGGTGITGSTLIQGNSWNIKGKVDTYLDDCLFVV